MAAASAQPKEAPEPQEAAGTDQARQGEQSVLEAAAEVVEQAEALTRSLARQVSAARQRGDIILVTCLTDKHRRAQATLSASRERSRSLQRALAQQQQEHAQHEHVVLNVLSQQLGQVRREAERCIGQDLYAFGAAQTVVAVDEETTDIDPLQPPADSGGRGPGPGSVPPPGGGAAPDLNPVLPPPVSPVM